MFLSISQPWPWYIAGPLIGLTVPALLILGNKNFGISSSLRHICAACIPAGIDYFKYDWKKEIWNLIFVLGIIIGGFLAAKYLNSGEQIVIHENLKQELAGYGITDYTNALISDELGFTFGNHLFYGWWLLCGQCIASIYFITLKHFNHEYITKRRSSKT